MARKYVDAHDLKPGDRAKIGPGQYGTVTAPTSRDAKIPSVITVHTDAGDVATTYPATVEVDR